MEILQAVGILLSRHKLCDACLGRQFAQLGRGIENTERGRILRGILQRTANGTEASLSRIEERLAAGDFAEIAPLISIRDEMTDDCFLCEGVIPHIDEYTERVYAAVKSSPYEYTTFLLGCKVPGRILEREDNLRSELRLDLGESLKNEISRRIGKSLQTRLQRTVAFLNPDLVALLDLQSKEVSLEPQPVFVYGRYRKLQRGIPQSIWLCSKCRGKGCEECQQTGRRYPISIEEFVSKPMVAAAEGENSKFHAAGREDVDARTLGTGRPFVVEIRRPKRRTLDMKELERQINEHGEGKVEVGSLSVSSRQVLRQLKMGSTQATKMYHALVEVEEALSEEQIETLEKSFLNAVVHQRTPLRVLHRRADRVRARRVFSLRVKRTTDPKRYEFDTETQGGLYVKEFISGDEGRTRPSVSEILGKQTKCIELDVMSVEGRKQEVGQKV